MKKKYSIFCPFLGFKSSISIDFQVISILESSLILGFFTVRKCPQKIFLTTIQSTTISNSYNLRQMITGVCLILIGIFLATKQFVIGNGIMILGMVFLSSSIRTNLCLKISGSDFHISVPFFEEEKLFEIQNHINLMFDMNMHKNNSKIK